MMTVVTPERPVETPLPATENPVEMALGYAEEWMREHGWRRGEYEDADGRVCLLGAVARGVRAMAEDTDGLLFLAARNRLIEVLNDNPVYWNDARCLSEAEALEVLRRARSS